MTQTEKLTKAIYDIVLAARTEGIIGGRTKAFAGGDTDDILQVCKDSGLKFTEVGVRGDALEGACICKVEEIEI